MLVQDNGFLHWAVARLQLYGKSEWKNEINKLIAL